MPGGNERNCIGFGMNKTECGLNTIIFKRLMDIILLMKIIITGGAGYIGTELVYKLSTMEIVEEILVYDNLCKGNYNLFTGKRKIENNKVRFIQADILDVNFKAMS